MPPLLALLAACADPKTAPPPEDTGAPEVLPALDLTDAVEAAAADNRGYGGVILRVEGTRGAVAWEGAAGDVARGGEAMDPSLGFEVASITKTATAATVLLLAEDGVLDLDAGLGTWLDADVTDGLLVLDGTNHGPDLTLRQLLGHTSGLPDYWTDPPYVSPDVNAFLRAFIADEDHLWTPEEILDYARELDPIAAPGDGFHYADTNYVLLGLVIEAVTGQALHDVFRDRIFGPLGMDDTWMSYHEDPASDLAWAHRYEGHEDLYEVPRQSADWAGGGLVSSAHDLGALFRALAQDALFADPDTTAAMHTTTPTDWEPGVDYGLGLIVVDLDDGYGQLWGHEGYGGSFAYVWPEQGLVLLGTVNQTEADPWTLIEEVLAQVGPPG